MKIAAVFLVLLSFSPLVPAQYRCIENGKTTFTDRPCPEQSEVRPPVGNSPKIIGDPQNSAYQTLIGDWRGQVQYQASQNGQPISEAHAVVPTTISIDSQGKVIGASSDNGCRMKGIASPGMANQMLNLDVTLSGCKFAGLNRRLFGSLTLNSAERFAQLWIYAHPVNLLNPGQSYDIKGTLRR